MKFKLLSIGQKFEYEGEVYIKTSPLVASNVSTSHNKMIPRYAMLTLLDNSGVKKQHGKEKLVEAQKTLDSFNLFYEKCISTLEENDVLVPHIKNEIDKARDVFIQDLI